MNKFQKLIVLLMVVTGALNTISASLQIAVPALNSERERVYFEHYYVQTLFMMLGESMCMVVYVINKYIVHRADPAAVDGDALDMNPLVLWPAAFLDLLATSLGYMGLAFMRDPGFFQMLRVSPIVFCGLLSIPILRQRLKWFNWIGILIIGIGIVIKSVPDAFPTLRTDKQQLGACVHDLDGKIEIEGGSSMDSNFAIGILLVLVGEFFHGAQFVYEEKYIKQYKLAPLKVVGIEGVCGVLTLAVLLWPFYFITLNMDGAMGGAALGPDGRLEDAIDGFIQIFNGDNGGWLICWTLGNMCSIAVFNFAGITVTKELSGTTRAVLDQIRIIIITIVFTVPLGHYLCRLQQFFHYTMPIGLVTLIIGVFMYNDVIIMPLIRKHLLKGKEEKSNEDSNPPSYNSL